MGRPKKEESVSKADVEAEEKKLAALMAEKQKMREEYEQMLENEKEELKNFKIELNLKKEQDELRKAGKLITMAKFIFHYQEEPGGTLQFTKQLIRYELTDGQTYTYKKEIADHINSLTYPDRELVRHADGQSATLKVVGRIPRCSATVLETFEKEYDLKTDIPNQAKWRSKTAQII